MRGLKGIGSLPVSRPQPTQADQHRYARELERANEELRRANRELEEFAFVAGHDLREPLRMVNIYTQLLLERYGSEADEEAQQFAGHIQYSVARMERLIEDVLKYSQVIHQGSSWVMPVVSLRDPLDQAIAGFRERLDAAGAVIDIDPLPNVLGDQTQIGLVFQNLLSNSLKYAHPRRPLSIRVRARRVANRWATYFEDNGIGFSPEFAERIFGLFKRLHGREVPGTGLGLAVCRRIIERFGGEMWAQGDPDAGATFIFTLRGTDEGRWGKDEAGSAHSAGRGQPR